jgi:hypothetical protein
MATHAPLPEFVHLSGSDGPLRRADDALTRNGVHGKGYRLAAHRRHGSMAALHTRAGVQRGRLSTQVPIP